MKKALDLNNVTKRERQKINAFKNVCVEISTLSHDPKLKVGTIIITDDFRDVCAIGLNGNYSGGPNSRDSSKVGMSGFLHSEENALFHLSKPYELRDNLIMICTHKPCPMCAKRIVNSGIKRVLYINEYAALGLATDTIFTRSGVFCSSIHDI